MCEVGPPCKHGEPLHRPLFAPAVLNVHPTLRGWSAKLTLTNSVEWGNSSVYALILSASWLMTRSYLGEALRAPWL